MAVVLHVINSAMMIATLAMVYGAIQRSHLGFQMRHVALGLCFGAGAVVGMLQPLSVGPEAIVDARALFLGFAGAFLSPAGASAALLVGVIGRIAVNVNSYTLLGSVSICVAVMMGGLWPLLRDRLRLAGIPALLLLGAMISLSLFSVYLAPTSGDPVHLVLILLAYHLSGSVIFGTIIQRQRRRALRERAAQIEAETDPLTGLLNRRNFERLFQQAKNLEGSGGTTLLLIDVDRFKSINDRFGHDIGDEVLKSLAAALRGAVRQRDSVLRFGGEEFAVVLPDTSERDAREAAERILDRMRITYPVNAITVLPVTVSIGVHHFKSPMSTSARAYKVADSALYAAKAEGRNRFVIQLSLPEFWTG